MTSLHEVSSTAVRVEAPALLLETLDNIETPMSDMEKGIVAGVIVGLIVVGVILLALCL